MILMRTCHRGLTLIGACLLSGCLKVTHPVSDAIVAGTITVQAEKVLPQATYQNDRVSFYVDGQLIGSDTQAPYTLSWDTTQIADGAHRLVAQAFELTQQALTTSSQVAFRVRNHPLVGTVTINNNAAYTAGTVVTLALSAQGPGPAAAMRLSADGTTFTEAEPFAASRTWPLSPGDGPKQVVALFQDAVGNWSDPASDTIQLDTRPPAGTLLINNGAATAAARAVTLTCDVRDAGAGLGAGALMRFSNNGTTWSAAEAFQATKSWTLSTGNGQKTVWARFADALGNWTTEPITATTLFDSSDGTQLKIFDVRVRQITGTTATVTWQTTVPADSQVDYGPTTAYGQSTARDSALVTSHQQTLTGLSAASRYHLRVRSLTAANQQATSADVSFTTWSQWTYDPLVTSGSYQSLFVDIDNDGDLDLVQVAPQGPNTSRLFRNEGGAFIDSTAQAGDLATAAGSPFTDGGADFYDVDAADIDADGDWDVVIGREGFNRLLRNDGNSRFTDVTEQAGADQGSYSRTVAPFDSNLDGLIDLYFGNDFWPRQDFLFTNLGKGFFEDRAIAAGIVETQGALDVAAGDYDQDGDADLFLADYEGPKVYRNEGAAFTNVTAATGLTGSYAAGVALGDYDNDGDLDVNMTHYFYGSGSGNHLYRNNGNGTFTNVAATAGVAGLTGRNTAFLDLDNDGWLDLLIGSTMYRNNQDGTFSAVSTYLSPSFADYDDDGDLDSVDYRNTAPPNHWLKLHLQGRTNRFGLGAQVSIITGALTQVRHVGLGAGNVEIALPLLVGLGPYDKADLVAVRWPSGVIQTLTNVAADQRLTLQEPADTRAPTLLAVQAANVAPTQAVVSWSSDEAADSQVEFGPSTSYGTTTPLEAAPVTFHKQLLTGLSPNTTYHFRVRSRDGSGNLASSQDYTFTTPAPPPARTDAVLLDEVQAKAARYFYEQALANGLVKDRSDTPYASIGATGYGLLALVALADRAGSNTRWTITAAQAKTRAELILDTLLSLQNQQSEVPYGNSAGIAGCFYRYLDANGQPTALSFNEVSTVDSAFAIAGALAAGEYFGGTLKTKAELLFQRVDWDFFLNTNPLSPRYLQYSMGWRGGTQPLDTTWDRPTDETLLVNLLGLTQDPTNAQKLAAWYQWPRVARTYAGHSVVHSFYGSLFTYFMAHAFLDFKSLGPDVPSRAGSSAPAVNWFENAKQAGLANRAFAINHSFRYLSYGENAWGLSSCQRADDAGYFGQNGARPKEEASAFFDGTLPPAAAVSMLPILRTSATEALSDNLAFKALRHYYDTYFAKLWGPYGPKAAFNDRGQFSQLYLGIDVGPMVALMENYRSGLLTNRFMRNRHIVAALQQLFTTPPALPPGPSTPTLSSTVPPATQTPTLVLTGTKGAGTSLWLNGQQIIGNTAATTWTYTLTLIEGANMIGLVAKDAAGVESGAVAHLVWLDTRPPTAPTLTNPPAQVGWAPFMFSGTKEAYTAIWINGQQVVPVTSETTWSVAVNLAAGPNTLTIRAVDRAGNVSPSISHTVNYDPTPPTTPVVTDDGRYTTTLNQLHARWSSQDPESGIQEYVYLIWQRDLNGSETVFRGWQHTTTTEVTLTGLSLTLGYTYFFEVQATNGAGAPSDLSRSDGITPTLVSSCTPADRATFVEGQTLNLSAGTSIASPQYQFTVDGVVKRAWASSATFAWPTSSTDVHRHTIGCAVRSGTTQDERRHDVYIFRQTLGPPPHQ